MSYFIGAMVPEDIREILSSNRPDIADVRWVKPDKYHITFEYFAELSKALIEDVHRKVQKMSKFFPLQCEAHCYSGFPSYRKARVVIVRLELANCEVHRVCDNKQFKPHITVGYARNRKVLVPQNLVQHSFSFARPALFRSENGIYTEITADRF